MLQNWHFTISKNCRLNSDDSCIQPEKIQVKIMADIKTEYESLIERIKSMAANAPAELHNELYPQKLGEKISMQVPEIRLTVISKYEGMGVVLQKLGANISQLESMINYELDKIS